MIQKVREAIGLFAANLPLFSLIILTVWLPGSILLVYLRLYVFPETTGGDEFRIFAQELRVANAIELIFGPFYTGALLHAASQAKQGLPVNYGKSMAHAAKRSFKLLGTRITTGILVLLGTIAFIIPGVILALRFALVDAVVVLEGVAGAKARKLSVRLTQGKRWKILGALTLTVVGLLIVLLVEASIVEFLLPLVGQGNFAIAVVEECLSNILVASLSLVLFSFYWEAKNQRLIV